MLRILGSLFIGLLTMNALHAGIVEATVDKSKVVRGDSVQLSITVMGEEFDNLPDIPTIAGVDVLNSQRSQGSRYSYINGESKSEQSETLILEFEPDKNVTIPPFKFEVDGKMEESEPILIEVVEPSNQIISTQKFSLDLELDKKSVALGEPIIATVHLRERRDADVMRREYQHPSFKSFFSKPIGEEKSYQVGDYVIHELKYQLIAKTAGQLTLEPIRAKIAEPVQKRDFIGFITTVPKWTNLSTGSRIIEVTKPQREYDLVGKYQLHDQVDTQKVKSNKPVNLTITLQGEGSLEDYEGITFDIPGVTVYSDEAKVTTQLVGSTLQSHYSKNYVFIADHNFVIPSVSIKAYDYQTHSIQTLTTKNYTIAVEGSSVQATAPVVHTKESVEPAKSDAPSPSKTVVWNVPAWWMLLVSFMSGGVVALLVSRLIPTIGFKRHTKGYQENDALTILYPHMHESDEVEAMVRKLYDKRAGKKVEIDKVQLKALVERYRTSQ